jgi:hypothetical protein
MALWRIAEHQGLTPYLDEQFTTATRSLRRIQGQQRRLRALLKEAPQPRQVWRN